MQVTGSNFQLEASQMKLCHLLDCDLIKYTLIFTFNYFKTCGSSFYMFSSYTERDIYKIILFLISKQTHLQTDSLNLRYKSEISDIVSCASKELDLEQKLRSTEEEWAEQSLHFSQFKNRGYLMLDAR